MKRTIIIALSLVLVLLAFTSCEEEIHVHTWDEGTVTKAASCTEDGEVVYKCACGEKKTQVIKATGHKLVETIVDSTYLKKGSVTVKCSECDEYPVSTYTLDRKDATGLGGELILQIHEGSDPEEDPNDPDLYRYMSFAILRNNEAILYFCNSFAITSDTINLYEDIADYVIKEEVNEEGEVSYSISLNGMSIPVIEKDGKVTVSYPISETETIDIELTPDLHVHTGEEVIVCEDPNTPDQGSEDPCMYFECETEKCLTLAGKEVSVMVIKTHEFKYDPETGRDICSNCGVKHNFIATP